MSSRLIVAAVALAFAASARADDAALPANVLQVQPLGRAMADVKSVVKTLGGDKAVKDFDAKIDDKFGEKGFAGLDLTKAAVRLPGDQRRPRRPGWCACCCR